MFNLILSNAQKVFANAFLVSTYLTLRVSGICQSTLVWDPDNILTMAVV